MFTQTFFQYQLDLQIMSTKEVNITIDKTFEYDYDYEGYDYQTLYITNLDINLSEIKIRNAFSKLGAINSCKIFSNDKINFASVTLNTYADIKEFIKESVLTQIDEKPIYVSFFDKKIRYGYKKNYKYKIYKYIMNDGIHISALSRMSQYQARTLIHEPNILSQWLKLSWNYLSDK